jgi:NDP-sugar pyrophosphorylase family protein
MGSRYGGLKQIDPVGPGGETIVDYSVFDALRAGFGRFVFVIRREHEADFRETFDARFGDRVSIEYAFQGLGDLPDGFTVPTGRTKPWGTGQAILAAANTIKEPFASINADDFYGANSFRILGEHLVSGSRDYAMVGFVLRKTLSPHGHVSRGVGAVGADGYLQNVVEIKAIEVDGGDAKYIDEQDQPQKLSGDRLVSMNLWGFTPTLFDHLRIGFRQFLEQYGKEQKSEYLIPDVVNSLVNSGQERCKMLSTPDTWFGVTYREDRPRVVESIQQLITRGEYPEKLWQ